MLLLKKLSLIILCLLFHFGFSQSEGKSTELFVKAGTSINATSQTEFGIYDDDRSHYAYSPSSGYSIKSINNEKLNYFSPYASLGIYHKGKKWFGFYTGLTYTQYKQSFNYSSYTVSNLTLNTSGNFHYNENDVTAKGSIINNVFRFEFTPVVFIKRMKISFPFINFDLVYPQIQTNLKAQIQSYYKIEPTPYGGNYIYSSTTSTGSQQNVPISINKSNFTYPSKNAYMPQYGLQTPKPIPFIYIPLSIKIERAVIIEKTKWLLGASAYWSPRAGYYGFSFYIGYCIWSSTKRSI